MTANPTRLDNSKRGSLAWCRECPSWRELRATKAAALAECATHVAQVHDKPKLAASLRARGRAVADTPGVWF